MSDIVGPVSISLETIAVSSLLCFCVQVSLLFFLILQEGVVYAVEFSHRSGRDLVNMAKKRTNVIPIIEDARHPAKYRMLVGMVDVIFSDVAQPDQVCFPAYFHVVHPLNTLSNIICEERMRFTILPVEKKNQW